MSRTPASTVWQTPLAPEYKNHQGDGPRATPTIVGDRVFAFTGEGLLVAANMGDGKITWSQNVVTQHKGKVADYGMASSPLVVGDLVIVTAGAPQGLRRRVSTEVRRAALGPRATTPTGYSSPALLDVGGRRQVVVFTGSSAIGLTPETGSLLWRYPYETDYDCNIAVPLAVDGKVFISTGENHGSVLLASQATRRQVHGRKKFGSRKGRRACSAPNGRRPFCSMAICTASTTSAARAGDAFDVHQSRDGRAGLAAAAIRQVQPDRRRRQAVFQQHGGRAGRRAGHAQGLRRNRPQAGPRPHTASTVARRRHALSPRRQRNRLPRCQKIPRSSYAEVQRVAAKQPALAFA